MKQLYLVFTCALTMAFTIDAQTIQKEEFVIPLTNPANTGRLEVGLHQGGVKVRGYDGKEVRVTMEIVESDDQAKEKELEKGGLRRINNNSVNVQIEEYDNTVEISGDHSKQTNFIIQVPQKFDLNISTHHDGDVTVENVSGTMEVNCHFGKMNLRDISGSLIADSHHGEIEVTFKAIDAGKPMAFSTYHGDVDVTFPASASFDAKVKTTKGEIYTDFDVDMKMMKSEEKTHEDGRRQIKIGGWMYGQVGSGGEEFMFNTYHGDVIIRQK
ncbi:MAG: DUF4097 family beta strand repeat protein [Saprospiraceae bacterium]|nr:DUF4097 family beta strand repeat protein [Saprospiraceae bacterium]